MTHIDILMEIFTTHKVGACVHFWVGVLNQVCPCGAFQDSLRGLVVGYTAVFVVRRMVKWVYFKLSPLRLQEL